MLGFLSGPFPRIASVMLRDSSQECSLTTQTAHRIIGSVGSLIIIKFQLKIQRWLSSKLQIHICVYTVPTSHFALFTNNFPDQLLRNNYC